MKKLLVTLGLAASIGVALPARNASATYYSYAGTLVNAHSWFWTGYWGGLITWNRASYPGSGTVRVGIQSYYNFGGYYLCRHMANNYVAATCYVNGGQVGVANGSDHRHTINGRVDVCWGCSLSRTTGPAPDLDREVPLQTTLDEIAKMPFHLDSQKARRVLRDDDKASFFEVSGSQRCLFREGHWDESTAVTCATGQQIAAGKGVVVSDGLEDLDPGLVRVMGMAPAGATGVIFQLGPEDDPVEIPVVDGAFVAEVPGSADQEPTRVEFVQPGDDDPALPSPAEDAGGCSAAGSGMGGSGAGVVALLALAALLGLGGGLRRRIA